MDNNSCVACGGRLSDGADRCSQCGVPLPPPPGGFTPTPPSGGEYGQQGNSAAAWQPDTTNQQPPPAPGQWNQGQGNAQPWTPPPPPPASAQNPWAPPAQNPPPQQGGYPPPPTSAPPAHNTWAPPVSGAGAPGNQWNQQPPPPPPPPPPASAGPNTWETPSGQPAGPGQWETPAAPPPPVVPEPEAVPTQPASPVPELSPNNAPDEPAPAAGFSAAPFAVPSADPDAGASRFGLPVPEDSIEPTPASESTTTPESAAPAQSVSPVAFGVPSTGPDEPADRFGLNPEPISPPPLVPTELSSGPSVDEGTANEGNVKPLPEAVPSDEKPVAPATDGAALWADMVPSPPGDDNDNVELSAEDQAAMADIAAEVDFGDIDEELGIKDDEPAAEQTKSGDESVADDVAVPSGTVETSTPSENPSREQADPASKVTETDAEATGNHNGNNSDPYSDDVAPTSTEDEVSSVPSASPDADDYGWGDVNDEQYTPNTTTEQSAPSQDATPVNGISSVPETPAEEAVESDVSESSTAASSEPEEVSAVVEEPVAFVDSASEPPAPESSGGTDFADSDVSPDQTWSTPAQPESTLAPESAPISESEPSAYEPVYEQVAAPYEPEPVAVSEQAVASEPVSMSEQVAVPEPAPYEPEPAAVPEQAPAPETEWTPEPAPLVEPKPYEPEPAPEPTQPPYSTPSGDVGPSNFDTTPAYEPEPAPYEPEPAAVPEQAPAPETEWTPEPAPLVEPKPYEPEPAAEPEPLAYSTPLSEAPPRFESQYDDAGSDQSSHVGVEESPNPGTSAESPRALGRASVESVVEPSDEIQVGVFAAGTYRAGEFSAEASGAPVEDVPDVSLWETPPEPASSSESADVSGALPRRTPASESHPSGVVSPEQPSHESAMWSSATAEPEPASNSEPAPAPLPVREPTPDAESLPQRGSASPWDDFAQPWLSTDEPSASEASEQPSMFEPAAIDRSTDDQEPSADPVPTDERARGVASVPNMQFITSDDLPADLPRSAGQVYGGQQQGHSDASTWPPPPAQ